MDKVNLLEKFAKIHELWSPRLAGEMNDDYVKLVKLKGEFEWHSHAEQEEMFWVVRGRLTIALRDRDIELAENEFFIIPRGVEHRPVAAEECWAVLFEPKATLRRGRPEDADEVIPWV
jgi:mannose-6-phosphate isomerase-like protein (cupin superfamily)